MPEYQAPGVYVEEISFRARPIEGASTGTVAFLGETERGSLQPRLVTSLADYRRLFGDVFAEDRYLPFAVRAFFANGGERCYVARIVGRGAKTASFASDGYEVDAIGPGSWGNRLFVRLSRSTGNRRVPAGRPPEPIGFRLQVAYWRDEPPDGPDDAFDEANRGRRPRPDAVEDFDDLSLDPADRRYWRHHVTAESSDLIRLHIADDKAATLPGDNGFAGRLLGGADGAPPRRGQFKGRRDERGRVIKKRKNRRGLAALKRKKYRDVAIVHAPGIGNGDDVDTAIQRALVRHCERNRFRFAVLDAAPGLTSLSDQRLDPRSVIDSSYAAFYYPWYYTRDPRTGAKILVPPGGAVCGIYAATDRTRGVWKAPANVAVNGALGLEVDVNTPMQEVLNPRAVNCIRRFAGRGIRVWGSRTLATDPEWKYVPVRRLFLFLEASIYRSTEWVVFEPNGEALWARVKESIEVFLRDQWRAGALQGEKEEDAFFVSVGRDLTMTQDDILNGRLVVEIGVAAVKPAEFVILRIGQKTMDAGR
jgi:phage tail sheath protein FI